jgi:hypothetical protein
MLIPISFQIYDRICNYNLLRSPGTRRVLGIDAETDPNPPNLSLTPCMRPKDEA